MSNIFKVKVVGNIGEYSERYFGGVGSILTFKDGFCNLKDDRRWYSDSFDELKLELSEDDEWETKIELVEEGDNDMECNFKIGDLVEVLKPFQPIKIKGIFDYVDNDSVTAIIRQVSYDSISIIYCDDDYDEKIEEISIDAIINKEYEIIKVYK